MLQAMQWAIGHVVCNSPSGQMSLPTYRVRTHAYVRAVPRRAVHKHCGADGSVGPPIRGRPCHYLRPTEARFIAERHCPVTNSWQCVDLIESVLRVLDGAVKPIVLLLQLDHLDIMCHN